MVVDIQRMTYLFNTIINFKRDKTSFLKSKSMEEEIFGPIIPVYYFNSYDEVNEIVKINNEPLVLLHIFKQKDILNDDIRSGFYSLQ